MTQKQVRTLVVAYNAFQDDMKDDDDVGLRVWAGILSRAQRDTGVVMIPYNELAHWATYTKKVFA